MTATATGPFADVTVSGATLRRFLHGLPGVDQVGVEARAAGLPARVAAGLVHVHDAFYYHAWPEVFVEGPPGRGFWPTRSLPSAMRLPMLSRSK